MSALEIHVFKDSLHPVTELLDSEGISCSMRQERAGVMVASSGILEVALNAGVWASIAAVLISFIKARHGRRVMITTKDKEVIHAEGLTSKELGKILEKAEWVTAIDPNKSNNLVQPMPKDGAAD